MIRLIVYILVLVVMGPSFSLAAEEALIEVTVTDSEGPLSPHTQTISAEKYRNKKITIPEVLSKEAGVHLTRYGGIGELGSLSIRGSSPDEILITLDGIPLNTAEGGAIDLSFLSIEDLSSLQIDKGGQEGLGAFSGAIRLKSKRIEDGFGMRSMMQGGSYKSFGGSSEVNYKKNNWGFVFSQSVHHTSGNYSFLDDNGTPFNVADDRRVPRANNESTVYHPFFKIAVSLDEKTDLSFLTHFIIKQNGVPGITSNQSSYTDLTKKEVMTSVNWQRRGFLREGATLSHLTYARFKKEQFADLRGEIGLGGTQDNDNDTSVFGSRLEWDLLEDFFSIKPFVGFQTERFRPEDYQATPSKGSSSVRHSLTGGTDFTLKLWGEKFKFEPTFWGDAVFNSINNNDPSFLTPGTFVNNDSSTVWNAQLKSSFQVADWMQLSGSLGYHHRFPTFAELFGDRGGVLGNPNLNPQTAIDYDLGISAHLLKTNNWLTRLSGSVAYFDRRVDNLILFEQQAGFARAENSGKAHVQGIESKLNVGLLKNLGASLNYTFQEAKDQALYSGKFLPGRPRHELNLELDQKIGSLSLTQSYSFMDQNYLDPLNTRQVASRSLLSSGIGYRFNEQWQLSFDVKNITNSQVVDVIGFPLPGRSFWGQISYEFKSK